MIYQILALRLGKSNKNDNFSSIDLESFWRMYMLNVTCCSIWFLVESIAANEAYKYNFNDEVSFKVGSFYSMSSCKCDMCHKYMYICFGWSMVKQYNKLPTPAIALYSNKN